MRNSGGSRLSYANVVSTLALFMAMGGTALAVNEWTGANIQDETLTGADIRGRAATSSTPPVNGLITTYDVAGQAANATYGTPEAPGTLTTYDIADGQIRGIDLAGNTVTGDNVRNASLTGADLTKGTLTGSHIADGSIAPADLAPDAIGFSRIQVENGPQDSGGQGADLESRAFCPIGWDISGGGYHAFVNPGNDGDVSVAVSRPFFRSSPSDQSQWFTRARNVGGIGVGTAFLTAYAICVR